MHPYPQKQLIFQKRTLAAIIAVCIMTGIAFYLELLGWRIINPGLSFSQAWSWPFASGALRTASGAAFVGIIPVVLGMIPRRLRTWTLSHCVLLWCIGAGMFLLGMTALIMWAP